MSLPEPHCVRGAVLGPLVKSRHPSGIGCIADTPGITLTHIRADTAEGPVNRLEIHPPEPALNLPVLEGPTLYAGPYFAHFGHMLAECIHRLWAVHHFAHLRGARILFQAETEPARPAWCDAVLDMCGIAPERVLLLDRTTRIEELHIPAQGRALGGALLFPDYPSLFPLVPIASQPGGPPHLYISRSRHIGSGTYLGESLIERLLAQAGFTIVHPQDMPIRAVAEMLKAAETIIFAEGSAIHNLELTGPVRARVMVIGRREGLKRRFGAVLESLCNDVRLFAAARTAGSLEWDAARDAPRHGVACSLVPIPRLIEAISDFTGITLPQPDQAEIIAAMASDLLRYLLDLRAGVNASDAELGRALRALRTDPGIAELRTLLAP